MFILGQLEDHIQIQPSELRKPLALAIREQIQNIYLNKVIKNLGLSISVYDIQQINGSFILPGEGGPHYQVDFRLILFRPFVGEIIQGKIHTLNEQGISVTLDFFSKIYIPNYRFPENCRYEKNEAKWVWTYADNEIVSELNMEKGDQIQLRVLEVKFDVVKETSLVQSQDQKILGEQDRNQIEPMEIIGDINMDGLGPTYWWQQQSAEDDEDG